MKENKFEDLKMIEIEALESLSTQIEDLMDTMDEYRFLLKKDEIRFFEKTYKNLGWIWEQLQDKLIYLWGSDDDCYQ